MLNLYKENNNNKGQFNTKTWLKMPPPPNTIQEYLITNYNSEKHNDDMRILN